MYFEDPRDIAPEIVDDPKKSPDQEKDTKTRKDDDDDDFQYTDWASI